MEGETPTEDGQQMKKSRQNNICPLSSLSEGECGLVFSCNRSQVENEAEGGIQMSR